jgi:NAD(P)-dependent dehydrogenase (short-subunit alcohol dehydrogenase family)
MASGAQGVVTAVKVLRLHEGAIVMSRTILITGASSGIGKATAKLFQGKRWNVIATMRCPENETELNSLKNVLVTRLDVTDASSIEAAVNLGLEKFGKVDALLNNAGYGAYGPLEAFPMENIRRQFDTNVIGLLEVTKSLLPHFRENKSGVIVNVSSIGGKMTFPLGTLYHGTKFAVEGLSEALHYELEPLGIKVKIVEPGSIDTDFNGRSIDFTNDESLLEYQHIAKNLMAGFEKALKRSSPPSLVAEVIWTAVVDGTSTLRYEAGEDAKELMANRKALDDATFIGGIVSQFGLGTTTSPTQPQSNS